MPRLNPHRFLITTIISLMFIVAAPFLVRAQKAVASLDTTSIRLGEQVQLKLDVTLPKAAKVSWPVFTDSTFSPIEIVNQGKVDTIETDRSTYVHYRQLLTITAFDSGYKVIPPVEFGYALTGDTSRLKALTDTLLLHVRTMEVDTTQAIKDIKAPMSAPLTLEELWPVFAGIAVIGLIVGAIWYYLWRRKMKKPLFPILHKPQLPPWQLAIESLKQLEAKKLWQNGKVKEYYTELTDVLRTYLENQFKIPAMEMISSDIVDSFTDNPALNPHKEKVWQVLELADLVKFAKEMPLPNENDLSLSNTRSFISDTRPEENQHTDKNADENNTTQVAE